MIKPTLLLPAFMVLSFAATAQNTAPAKSIPSAGLANDFMREQNPGFTNWDLGGQVRGRFEAKSGFAVPGAGANAVDFSKATPDNNYWLFREKVHLGWAPVSWLKVFGEGRDSSTIDDQRRPKPEDDSLDLHQAWVLLGDTSQFPVTAKVGRQELSYGDERLVGAFDWSNVGRVFDAAKLRYENQALWVDAFASRVVLINDDHFNVSNDYDWFSGLYASTDTLIPRQQSQLYFLARNTSAKSPTATTGSPQAGGPPARDIYTFGARVSSRPDQFAGWDYDAEAAGQLGDFYDTTLKKSLDHQAFAGHAAGGYTFKETFGAPRLGLEYNYASGDHDASDGRHETFENLFPTNHRFYGYMDFISWQNIHNPRLSASAKPVKGLSLTADYHLFWLADTHDSFYSVSGAARKTGGYGIKPANSSLVGSELDLIATYAIRNIATLQAGYGHFFRGDYVSQSLAATGSKDADWFYAQATLNF